MSMIDSCRGLVLAATWLLGACSGPAVMVPGEPETLTIRDDGTMWFRDRQMSERDVILYEDGRGGEKAAVRVHLEPLHPDFFRDTIVVVRE